MTPRLSALAATAVLGVVGRLDPQKGFDLFTDAAHALLEQGARLAVLGTGDHSLVAGLRAQARAVAA